MQCCSPVLLLLVRPSSSISDIFSDVFCDVLNGVLSEVLSDVLGDVRASLSAAAKAQACQVSPQSVVTSKCPHLFFCGSQSLSLPSFPFSLYCPSTLQRCTCMAQIRSGQSTVLQGRAHGSLNWCRLTARHCLQKVNIMMLQNCICTLLSCRFS